MAENNTFNFDLDAPATPTLTLDPVEEAAPAEEKKPEPAPAPEEVKLTAEEKGHGGRLCAEDRHYQQPAGAAVRLCLPKKIGDFSEAALAKVSTKDLGEVGNMITDLIGELKSFDANEEQQKGILGFFKKKERPDRQPEDQVQQGRDECGEHPVHAGGPSGAAAQGHRHAG